MRGNSGIGLSALADGKADVFINGRFLPDSKLVDISRNRELLWIDGNPKKIEAAAAEWGYKMVTVPKDGYPFMGGKDSPTVTQWTTINSGPKVSEEIIYKFVKALYEGADRIRAVHPSLREFSGRQMVRNPMGLPIHPGAERFYREQGLL